MSFPQLLTSRRLGEPGAQGKIEEALNRKIENALVNDCFHSKTIELPTSSEHRISRCQDFAAVLSVNDTHKKVALWSLTTKCKLWDLEITKYYLKSHLSNCQLNEQGMVLVDLPSTGNKIILLDGKRLGTLPPRFWASIDLVGKRILGCWRERRCPNDPEPRWLLENTDSFFSEYDEKGSSLNRYQLDNTRGRWTHLSVCNENYWVWLSGSSTNGLPSIIEVINRVKEKMTTYALPLSPKEEEFSSACLVQDRLFYGKNVIGHEDYNIQVKREPTIGIFDLVKGKIIEEYPTGSKNGEPRHLVATQRYAAWLDYEGEKNDHVKYLDILNKTIKVATTVSYCVQSEKVTLNIMGTVLSVIYAQGCWNGGDARWRRKVIDLTNGELKCDVKYKRVPYGDCSIENGNLLITDCFSRQYSMYIESFFDEGISNEESTFRAKPIT